MAPTMTTPATETHVYIDADACPVKDETYRVARRYGLHVTVVANSWMRTPMDDRIRIEVVGRDMDAADDWIAERVAPNDIVITADVPLAARCVEAGALVLSPTGRPFTEDNVADALATRDLLTELRSGGVATGGPPPMSQRDRSRFLQELDKIVQQSKRRRR